MSSKVYFMNLKSENKKSSLPNKLKILYDKVEAKSILSPNDKTAIKMHFGEKGNLAYIHPVLVRAIVDKTKESKVEPFLTDTNTLYTGSRTNSVVHLQTAIENGFSYATIGAPIIIADGLYSKNSIDVNIELKHFKTAKIAGDIYNANSMVVLSHFKGHGMAGFGGSIKNLAMGCASAAGKQQQHSVSKPKLNDNCVGCGICVSHCPVNAITIKSKKAIFNHDTCIGCGECTTVCSFRAIKINWETDSDSFLERMAEYAYGAVKDKQNKVIYFNFITNVSPLCDCVAWNDVPLVRDIGILASTDPVAIDQASLDLVNNEPVNPHSQIGKDLKLGEDKFKHIHKHVDGSHILKYGEEIGLGKRDYELIQIQQQ
ncbi:DUF362 domain-containing protein [Clostridium sp. 'deep sea']|uniref:DUF362 domain-containing protein n=1 Tax=Clostridium sp. 'deep sea' TaxID=2779445 RepID=UPI0018968F33|nr:DUF362 domain-containing protein [Clostridium sp. 'deep sea']QOR34002.1 DUF362 domain-containing protein [Clostridium sp. 'deep sea']